MSRWRVLNTKRCRPPTGSLKRSGSSSYRELNVTTVQKATQDSESSGQRLTDWLRSHNRWQIAIRDDGTRNVQLHRCTDVTRRCTSLSGVAAGTIYCSYGRPRHVIRSVIGRRSMYDIVQMRSGNRTYKLVSEEGLPRKGERNSERNKKKVAISRLVMQILRRF